jgi:hypothetical protein
MLLIPGGMAAFIGIHLYLVTKLGIAEPPWSQRRLAADRRERDMRDAARRRLEHGRTPVPATSDPGATPAPVAGGDA